MHADRTNRVGLAVLGLLAVLTGAAGLCILAGVFGSAYPDRTLLANQVGSYVGRNGDWLWPAAAAACLLIALASLRWIIALLVSTDRAGDITIARGTRAGTTTMHPAALAGAVTREIETYHGADSAKARVIGEPADLALVVTVTAARGADLAALHHRIEAEALSHARQSLGQPGLPIQLDIDAGSRAHERRSPRQLEPESLPSASRS
jgi:hypothetical protein